MKKLILWPVLTIKKLLATLAALAIMACSAAYGSDFPPTSPYVEAAFCPKHKYACCQSNYWHGGLGILWVKADGHNLDQAEDVDHACATMADARWNSFTYDCTYDTPLFQSEDRKISRDCRIKTYQPE